MTSLSTRSSFANAYQAGETKRNAGHYAEARINFEDALARSGTGQEKADARLGIALTYADWAHTNQFHVWMPPTSLIRKNYVEKLRQFDVARTEFEKVLAIPDITPDQKARAHYHLATVLYARDQYEPVQVELRKIIVLDGVSAEWRVKTQLLLGYYTRHGGKGDPMGIYAKVLEIPGVSPAQKAEALMAMVGILLEKRSSADAHVAVVGTLLEKWNRTEAHQELAKVFTIADLPPSSRALAQLALGKIFFLEANYDAARDALKKALSTEAISESDEVAPPLFVGGPTGRGTMPTAGSDRAEAQLYLGLSDYYEGKDYERAVRELKKVLNMPDASYVQVHDATLRLRLKKLLPCDEKVITVLFTGSSHTQVRNVPQIVEMLAVSAPAGRPRIIASQATFGGHTPQKLWDLGDGPGTPRRRIVSDPWDFLVIENASSVEHVSRFVDLARAENIRPILYETPVSAKLPYPDSIREEHKQSLAIQEQLKMSIAPASYAWMLYLGANPSTEERLALYHSDGVHTAKKGAYMVACTIYSTLTGFSPVGLSHDMASLAWIDCTDELTEEESLALQKASWQAFQETKAELK